MIIFVYGAGHLAETLSRAATLRGLKLGQPDVAEVLFVAEDVLNHGNLAAARSCFEEAVEVREGGDVPIVVVSQVPPGTVRAWACLVDNIFYQVDTIIMARAVARAYVPEQFIVGCADLSTPLPLAYQEYLVAHGCLVLQMSYESAEVAKCAINYVLAKQIESANILATACGEVGADYADVERAMRNDARIGPQAYLRPGALNQHLLRDVDAVAKLLGRESV